MLNVLVLIATIVIIITFAIVIAIAFILLILDLEVHLRLAFEMMFITGLTYLRRYSEFSQPLARLELHFLVVTEV